MCVVESICVDITLHKSFNISFFIYNISPKDIRGLLLISNEMFATVYCNLWTQAHFEVIV